MPLSVSQQLTSWVSRQFPDAIFYWPTAQKVVALTIDDVPAPNDPDDATTRLILATIAAHNQAHADSAPVQATFFLLTGNLTPQSTIVQEILAHGHEIANHGVTDSTHAWLSPQAFEHELESAHDYLSQLVQPHPISWYRPGRGLYNQTMVGALRRLSDRMGYAVRLALASMVPLDTLSPTDHPLFTTWYVQQFIFPGAILVLHGGSPNRVRNIAAVLPLLLESLRQQGYQVVTLSQLWSLGDKSPSPPSA